MLKASVTRKLQWIELLNVYTITMVRLLGTKIRLSQTCLIQAKGMKYKLQVNNIIYNNSEKTVGPLHVVLTHFCLNAVLISCSNNKFTMNLYG